MLKNSLLNHYHCTFFLPLIGLPAKIQPDSASDKCVRVTYKPGEPIASESYESFLYFTPTRRNILFDQANDTSLSDPSALIPMKEWNIDRSVFKNWRLELGMPEELPDNFNPRHLRQVAVFTSIKLYQFFNGMYLLAYTVRPEALVKLQNLSEHQRISIFDDNQHSSPRYLQDVESSTSDEIKKLYEELQLEAWLRFSRLSRQLYPTFGEQISESKIARLIIRDENHKVIAKNPTKYSTNTKENPLLPVKTDELLAPTLVHIGSLFFGESFTNSLHSIRLYDDRMFISVAYGLSGPEHDPATLACIKSLVALTDRFEDILGPQKESGLGYAYDPATTKALIDSTELCLWNHIGGHYFFNDMVNAYVSNGSFFRTVIADKHVPYIYDRMLVQALLYQASLRHYDYQLTLLTKQTLSDGAKNQPALEQHQQEFIQFTNQYWFKELTNQMQGKEIFRLQQQGLSLQPYYRQIETELTRTHDYRLAVNSENISSRSNRLAVWGIWFALAALLPTYITFWHDEKTPYSWKITVIVLCISTFIGLFLFRLSKKM